MSPSLFEVGPLEMEVLGLVESRSEPVSVSAVQEQLRRGGKELAYTTVMTLLTRLHQKGFLGREKNGRQFLYSAGTKRPAQGVFERVRRSLFRGDRLKPILALLDAEAGLSREELKALRRAVDERLGGKRK